MKLWGLTGGIGSGKSTASQLFRRLGAHVVDADAVYHQLLAPHGGIASDTAKKIDAAFPGVMRADGSIDRPALGAKIFADAEARTKLNALTHPAVGQAVQAQMAAWAQAGAACAIYDVPLLYENNLQAGLDGVVVVWVPHSVQLARLMGRDALSREAAQLRLAAQMPLDQKRDRARWVIDNSGDVLELQRQVTAVWEQMLSGDTYRVSQT